MDADDERAAAVHSEGAVLLPQQPHSDLRAAATASTHADKRGKEGEIIRMQT